MKLYTQKQIHSDWLYTCIHFICTRVQIIMLCTHVSKKKYSEAYTKGFSFSDSLWNLRKLIQHGFCSLRNALISKINFFFGVLDYKIWRALLLQREFLTGKRISNIKLKMYSYYAVTSVYCTVGHSNHLVGSQFGYLSKSNVPRWRSLSTRSKQHQVRGWSEKFCRQLKNCCHFYGKTTKHRNRKQTAARSLDILVMCGDVIFVIIDTLTETYVSKPDAQGTT